MENCFTACDLAFEADLNTALSMLHSGMVQSKFVYMNGFSYFINAQDWPAHNYPYTVQFNSLGDVRAAAAKGRAAVPGVCDDYGGAEFDLLRGMLGAQPETTIFDVGANYGREGVRYSLLRRTLQLPLPKNGISVFALEPLPVRHFAMLNYDLHGTRDVKLTHAAAGTPTYGMHPTIP